MPNYYLGIDLGGTEVKIAVVNKLGKIIDEAGIPSSNSFSPDALVKKIVEKSRLLKNFRYISGTGVGVAGDIDQKNGIVRFSPNLNRWKNIKLRAMLRRYLKGPIVIDNDANAAALGAYFLDAGRKAKNIICITLGTGVGGGIILEGKIYRGATGTAGEIGHIHYDANGPLCNCGSHGCIEVYAGAPRIIAQGVKIKSKILNKLTGGNMKNLTPKILQEAALLGDRPSQNLWKKTGTKLGVIFADLVNVLNPEMIIISGGVSKANRLLTDPIKSTVMQRAFKTPARKCKIIVSKFTSRLGVVGAALLAE